MVPPRIPAEIVLKEIREINPKIEIIGKYTTKKDPLSVRCRVCGFEWDSTANRLLAGHGCRKCAGMRKRGVHIEKKSHEQFVQDMAERSPDIRILSEYQNAKTDVECECAVCGHRWSARPTGLITGFGCPDCASRIMSAKQTKPHEQFVAELAEINPDIEAIGTYINNHQNVKMRCRKCGTEWYALPSNMLRRDGKATGCPHCRKSHGEKMIHTILTEYGIKFIPQKSFDGLLGIKGNPLTYDFYIPACNLLIEYQGEYHDHSVSFQTDEDFEKQKEHDRRKREYAEVHGIHLLEIWYYDNLEEKLRQELDNITDPVTITAS